ncbi:response regulator [Ramlibacter sp. RBP-2]|uniref:histidine kinase n=1 Tax=Ramlibacter lithotrophicus TaxID=2606681 RepID=A0A7X6DJR1_9BURK|nr:ATP-binding protein [Ramlibacter lithotrophicus]NKE68443.1 response regulator [Ramlibacter lithotrophicus]
MNTELQFLAGGGEMGARIRAMDWSRTPLGAPRQWPQSLRSALSILLPSKAQIALFWGDDLVTLYNDAYRPVFGRKHPGALGKPIREAWDELWRAGLKELFDDVRTTGEAFWARDRLFFMERHGYLEETYFDVSYDPVRDESGAVGGVFCIVSETTGRVVGERRLRTLRDLGHIAQRAQSVAEVHAGAAQVLGANSQDIPFALVYGLAPDGKSASLLGRHGLEAASAAAPAVLPLDGGAWPLAAGLQVLDGNEVAALGPLHGGPWPEPVCQVAVVPFALPDQPPLGWLVAGVSPRRRSDEDHRDFLRLAGANIAAAVASVRHTEDERQRARMLAELDRAKTTFFSNVSHEFRTPLTLMLGPMEDALADREQALPAAQRERIELARRSALRLQKLVNSLLGFTRVEAGRARARYAPTDLASCTAELASAFRSAIEKAGLRLAIDCPPLPQPVFVDRDMWEQLVLNLLSNALKFTFHGEIAVRLRAVDADVELQVRDTGIGIAPADRPYVFERFRRVEGARSRTHEGTGIGLALVKELARLHGGSVAVESVPDQGSTFTVRIPAGRSHLPIDAVTQEAEPRGGGWAASFVEEALRWLPDPPAAFDEVAQSPDEAAARTARRARVVLADDNADMRAYVARLLAPAHDVEAVADGEEALAAVRRRRPDLVLSDIMMPRRSGLELLQALRADPATAAIPFVLLSARAGEDSRIEGLLAGADDYLEKPFGARELLARVAARLEIARLRSEADAVLRQREQQLRFITDQVPLLILQIDAQQRYRFVNAAFARRIGIPAEALVGRHPSEVIGQSSYEVFQPLVERALAGERVEFEVLVPYQRMGPRWMHGVYVPDVAPDGPVQGFVAVLNDVTERRAAEEELRLREERLRAIVDTTPECIKLVAADGTLLQMNPSGLEMVGAPSAEAVVGHSVYALIAPEHRDAFRRLNEWVCRGERGRLEFDIVGLRGERRRMATHAVPLRMPDGRNAQLSLTRDITLQREAEDLLREADRRKDEFISILAHELRNPLAPLRNALHLLRARRVEPAAADRLHAVMERQTNHLVRLVDDLLEMSRINRGDFELRQEAVDAAAVARHAIETSEPLIRECGHRLDVDLPDEPLPLAGDAVRLAQVLANLLNNAARYTDRGGRITLRGRRHGAEAVLSVADSGIGFDPAEGAWLFGMFTRGDRSTGLGIGLALARKLVQMHGGSIEARSEGLGRGAEFIVRLPLAAQAALEPAAAAPEPEAGAAAAIGPVKVLVVDDNHDAADTMEMLLRVLGAQVRVARDGPQALEAFMPFDPDLVLLDIGMPGMDGYEVARALRGRHAGHRARMVALTGWGQEADRQRGREAGFDHHLVKPADIAAIQALLAELSGAAAARA